MTLKLGCTDDEPKFPNPSIGHEGEFVWFLFDAVHLIKCLRNHLIDQGTVWHFSYIVVKFGFSEKATKFEKKFQFYLYVTIFENDCAIQ